MTKTAKTDSKTPARPALFDRKKSLEIMSRQREQAEAPLHWKPRKFANLQHVKNYLGTVINRTEAGLLAPETATRLSAVVQVLVQVLKAQETEALEARLRELESKLADLGK